MPVTPNRSAKAVVAAGRAKLNAEVEKVTGPGSMAKVGGFKRPAAPAVDKTPKRPASLYSGIKSKPPREPMAPYGSHRVRLESASQHQHPVKKSQLTNHYVFSIVDTADESARVGDVFKVIIFQTGPGLREMGHMTMALIGLDPQSREDNDSYNEYNKDGRLYDATLGLYDSGQNWIDANGGNQPLIGRVSDVVVTKGNPVLEDGAPTGDHFRNFAWSPIPEEEQTAPVPEAPEDYWVD